MSVITPTPSASQNRESPLPQPVVKHPMSWYMPRFWHGMRFSTWARELARNRFRISPSRVPMTAAITCFALFNSALSAVERSIYGRRIKAVKLADPPVFILGHWRAGTTFLHELLIRDPAHAYPTTYRCFAPSHFVLSERFVTPWAGMFIPDRRPMDNMAAGWDRPMEDEFALANLGSPSMYLSWMFPNRGPKDAASLSLHDLPAREQERWRQDLLGFVQRLTMMDGRRLVLKSPTHTARIRTLRDMFPGARFVHIARDPYALYRSTVALWRSLSAEEGLQVVRDHSWVGRSVLDALKRMYDAYFEDRELLSADELVELRYEELVEDPAAQVRLIYERLGLGDYARIEPELNAHLTAVKNYRTNRHSLDDEMAQEIRLEWQRYFEEFGYA